jgi:hypothetical protein
MASILGSPAANEALDRAQELIYDAWDAVTPKQRVELAAMALAISPRCADAYVLLGEHAEPGSPEQLECYRRGVAAGEAALGKAVFVEDVGHFWGLLDTRPYMRARLGLARLLWARGAGDEALVFATCSGSTRTTIRACATCSPPFSLRPVRMASWPAS